MRLRATRQFAISHPGRRVDPYRWQYLLDASSETYLPSFAYSRSGPAWWLPQQDGSLTSFAADVLPRSWGAGGWGYEFHPGWTQYALHSTDVTDPAWGKTRCAAVNETLAHPLQGGVISRLVEDSSASTSHYVKSSSTTAVAGQSYTARAIFYPGARKHVALTFTGALAADRGVFVDLETGAITGAFGTYPAAYGAEVRADGGIDCYISESAPNTGSYATRVWVCNGQNSSVYTGNGVAGLYVAGLNLTNTSYPVPFTISTDAQGVVGNHTFVAPASTTGVNTGDGFTFGGRFEAISRAAGQYPSVVNFRPSATAPSTDSAEIFLPPTSGHIFALVRVASVDAYGQNYVSAERVNSFAVRAATDNFGSAVNGSMLSEDFSGALPSMAYVQVARDGASTPGAMKIYDLWVSQRLLISSELATASPTI